MLPKKGIVFPNVEKLKSNPPASAYLRVGEIGVVEFGQSAVSPCTFKGAKQSANLFDARLEDRRIRGAGPHGFAGR
jgi:hypothetical protein